MTSVEWVGGKVRFIDQTRLPTEEVLVETSDYRVVGDAIKKLKIRGAPAIGVAVSFALLLAIEDKRILSQADLEQEFFAAINFLSQTRPTAVNLFTALNRMRRVYQDVSHADVLTIRYHLLEAARNIQQEDVDACRKIGENGAELIAPGSSILTHCNTGALATAGEGTAQSVITTAARQNKVVRVFADETRPLFQGARLTSWELLKQDIDVTLITDSTAGYVMQQRMVSAVIVGADRIAANGDTANKIGTYSLAVLAERHAIPFYVAAPVSTIDFGTRSGREIPVEERDEEEVTHVAGIRIAAEGVKVYAPAFDVTPQQFITAIITEKGVLRPPYGEAIAALRLEASRRGGSLM
jgi:methylthioribose-1-phosphate isomerase